MSDTREEIENYINKDLPANFSSDEIRDMCDALQKDVVLLKKAPGMNDSKMGMICQHKHKMFAFSYPGLFFRIVKGELKSEVLNKILSIKHKMDMDEITLDQARMGVIDGAKEDIENNPVETRGKKVKPVGTVVQELNFKCKLDDEDTIENQDENLKDKIE